VWRLDLEAGTRRRVLAMTEAYSIQPAPGGASMVMHSSGSAGVFDVASGREIQIDDTRKPQSSAFDPTGAHVALGFKGGDIHLVDLRTPRRQTPLRSHEPRPAAEMWTLSWSEDGRWLCGLLEDEVLVWDAVLRRGVARLRGLSSPSSCRVRADGSVMAFNEHEVRTWAPPSTRVLDRGVVGVAASGDTWVTTHTDGRVVAHQRDESNVLGTRRRVTPGEYGGVKVMPGARLAVTWSGRRLDAWPLDGGKPWLVASLSHAMKLDFDDTGRWLAWIDNRTRISIVEMTSGVKHHIDAANGAVWTDVAFDRLGRLVTASLDRHALGPSQMHRFQGEGFTQRTDLEAPLPYPYAIHPLPGSDEIALIDVEGALALFDPESMSSRRIAERGPFGSMLTTSLDRTLLASTSWKGQVRLWNLSTGAEHQPRLDPGLAAGVGEVAAPATLAIEAAAFLDDGRLLAVDANGVLRSYAPPCPPEAAALRTWVLAATDLRVAPGDIAARERAELK
jgi:WD40 repeat protein